MTPLKRIGLLAMATVMAIGLGGSVSGPERTQKAALRTVGNKAFTHGEKLTFAVKYKFVTAGYATMQIAPKSTTVSERPCYDIAFKVRTTSSFDKIFKVRDDYRTYLDVDGIFPWRFQQTVREGDYKRDFSANIDQDDNKARTSEGTYSVSPFCQDILSAFYYARTQNLGTMKKGASFTLKNFYGKKEHTLKVKVLGKEKITVKAGTFNCVKVEPMVKEGGLFKSDGSIVIWMTDDDLHVPVKVSTKVAIGSIDSELISYSGLKGDLKAKVK